SWSKSPPGNISRGGSMNLASVPNGRHSSRSAARRSGAHGHLTHRIRADEQGPGPIPPGATAGRGGRAVVRATGAGLRSRYPLLRHPIMPRSLILLVAAGVAALAAPA